MPTEEKQSVYRYFLIGDKWQSVFATGEAAVDYAIGVTSRAPQWLAENGYDLFCYVDLDEVRLVANRREHVIVRCEATNVRPATDIGWIPRHFLGQGIFQPWTDEGEWDDKRTYLATTITPLEIVK